MNTSIEKSSTGIVPTFEPAHVVKRLLSGKSPRTIRAYRSDLSAFCHYLKVESIDDAARVLIDSGHGFAMFTVGEYRDYLSSNQKAPATINRKLAAIRSLIDVAKSLDLISWTISIHNVKGESYRDTKGPGLDGFKALLVIAASQKPEKAARDVALLWLLYCPALRRAEVENIDFEHLDLVAASISVIGKGRREAEAITIPLLPLDAIKAWLAVRGNQPGALFQNCDRARKGNGRLTADGIYKIVASLGKRAQIKVRPHGLRHAGITRALDLTNGDVRAVQRFSRHRDIRTVLRYDDNRRDIGGNVAAVVAAGST